MTPRRISQLALAAVLTGVAVWWFATRTDDMRTDPAGLTEPNSADYRGPDAVIHAVGAVKSLAGAELGRFDVWYDKPGKRFAAHTLDGLWMLYQDGVLRQLPDGAATSQRSEQVIGFDVAAERYLRYLRWVGDPGLLADLSVVAEETIDGERATKRLMPGMGHVWVGADGRLLRFEPLNRVDERIGLSYDQLTGVRPAEVPATVFAAAAVATMGAGETNYRTDSYKAINPDDMARLFAMRDYDTYWVGQTYHDFAFDYGDRKVTRGAAVEVLAFGSGQVVDRKDEFAVIYSSPSYPGVDRAFLMITSTPLTAFHMTIEMTPNATPAAVSGGSDAWTMGGETADDLRSLFFTRDSVQISLSSNTPLDLFQVAADLRLIRDDAP